MLNFLNHCVWVVLLLFLCCSLHFVWLFKCISLSGVFLLFSSVKLCADCYGLAYCLHFFSLSLSLYLNITYLKWRGFSFCSSVKGKKSLTKILCLPVSCHVQLKMLLSFLDRREVFEVETVIELVSCIHL